LTMGAATSSPVPSSSTNNEDSFELIDQPVNHPTLRLDASDNDSAPVSDDDSSRIERLVEERFEELAQLREDRQSMKKQIAPEENRIREIREMEVSLTVLKWFFTALLVAIVAYMLYAHAYPGTPSTVPTENSIPAAQNDGKWIWMETEDGTQIKVPWVVRFVIYWPLVLLAALVIGAHRASYQLAEDAANTEQPMQQTQQTSANYDTSNSGASEVAPIGADYSPPSDTEDTNNLVPEIMSVRTVTLTKIANEYFGLFFFGNSIRKVQSGSPAALKGVRAGDEIVAIEGTDYNHFSQNSMKTFDKCSADGKVILTLRYNPDRLRVKQSILKTCVFVAAVVVIVGAVICICF
ncbi:hypothetical protein PENTCL1PPCAC_10557, partial [Pristionchus entomophagus]